MKDAKLSRHLERKAHDFYAACVNHLAPVDVLTEDDLPLPRMLTEGGCETLDCGLEGSFYKRVEHIHNTVAYEPVRSFALEDVHVAGDQGFIYKGARRMVAVCEEVGRIPRDKVRRPIRWLRRCVEAPVFHLTGNNHESHGHFVLQHLPRLMAVRERLLDKPEVKLLLAPGHMHWQRFYLERLGFGPERLLEGTPGTLHCRQLEYVPFYNVCGNLVDRRTYRKMSAQLTRGAVSSRELYLFLSRKGARHRSLLNEDDVLHACQELWPKMQRVELQDYSPAGQVELFRNSRVIFGPHGQAFTNLIYTRDVLAIIASASRIIGGWSASFRNLALQMGGTGLVLTADVPGWKNTDHWEYPMDRLRTQLDRLQELLPDKYR